MVKNPKIGKKYWTISVSRAEMHKEVPNFSDNPWRFPDKEKAAIQKKYKPRQIILVEFSNLECKWHKNKKLLKCYNTYEGRLVSHGKYRVCQFGGLNKSELFCTKKAAYNAYFKYLIKQERKYLRMANKYTTEILGYWK
jgi:hypothetical protein